MIADTEATPIADLDLAHLDWETPEFAADPHLRFEAARDRHPWLARVNGGFVVHDLATIRELLVQDDRLRTCFDGIVDLMGAHGTRWGRFAQEQMIALPEREHAVVRGAFAARFTPRHANQLRPVMRETMRRLLDEWAPRQRIDFEEFASYYPVSVMAQMIGAPLDAIPALRRSMETLGLAFSLDATMLPRLDAAMEQFDAFVFGLIEQRRKEPGDGTAQDLLDVLIETGAAQGINDRQLADLLIFLFVAGYDTSKNVLTYTMNLLLDRQDIYERCAVDHAYCGKVIEEALRLFTPGSTFRATREDIVHRGVRIPAGTMLFFALGVSGQISADIENPHAFEPERRLEPHLRHVGFGLGRHMCLGQYIARAQLHEGLHLIAQRMRHPRKDGANGWRPFPGVWGIDGLPIAFETGAEGIVVRT